MSINYNDVGFKRKMREGKEVLYIRPRIIAGPLAAATTSYEIIDRSSLNINKGIFWLTPNNIDIDNLESITLSENISDKALGIRDVIFSRASGKPYIWKNVPNAIGVQRFIKQLMTGPTDGEVKDNKSPHDSNIQQQSEQGLAALNMRRDQLKVGGTAPIMKFIIGGEFLMGSFEIELGCENETPQHKVTTADFYLGIYPVTFAQWDTYVNATGEYSPDDNNWGRSGRPVINVSWNDVQHYIDWINSQTDGGYRIPTEAEWEYAARSGTLTKYSFGNTIDSSLANYDGFDGSYMPKRRFRGEANGKTIEAGRYKPNAFGLYDMHGNVYELTQDWWNDRYHDAPIDGSAWLSGDIDWRVIRGGAWDSSEKLVRSAFRGRASISQRNIYHGFRLAHDV